jgi:hypothetical protein
MDEDQPSAADEDEPPARATDQELGFMNRQVIEARVRRAAGKQLRELRGQGGTRSK